MVSKQDETLHGARAPQKPPTSEENGVRPFEISTRTPPSLRSWWWWWLGGSNPPRETGLLMERETAPALPEEEPGAVERVRAAAHHPERRSNAQDLWIGLGRDTEGVPSRMIL
jgi:hypothetical protein